MKTQGSAEFAVTEMIAVWSFGAMLVIVLPLLIGAVHVASGG